MRSEPCDASKRRILSKHSGTIAQRGRKSFRCLGRGWWSRLERHHLPLLGPECSQGYVFLGREVEVEGPFAEPACSDEIVERHTVEAMLGEGHRGRFDDVRPGPLGSLLFGPVPDHSIIIPTGRFVSIGSAVRPTPPAATGTEGRPRWSERDFPATEEDCTVQVRPTRQRRRSSKQRLRWAPEQRFDSPPIF